RADVGAQPLRERGDREGLRGEARRVMLELLDVLARGMLERLREEVVTRREVVRRRRERHSGLACDGAMRGGARTLATDDREGRLEDPGALRGRGFAASRRRRRAQ